MPPGSMSRLDRALLQSPTALDTGLSEFEQRAMLAAAAPIGVSHRPPSVAPECMCRFCSGPDTRLNGLRHRVA